MTQQIPANTAPLTVTASQASANAALEAGQAVVPGTHPQQLPPAAVNPALPTVAGVPQPAQAAPLPTPETVTLPTGQAPDWGVFQQELQATGKLGEASKALLQQLGAPDDVVSGLSGIVDSVGNNHLASLHQAAGGKAGYDAALLWASGQGDAFINQVNAGLQSLDSATQHQAMQQLAQAHQTATAAPGVPPVVVPAAPAAAVPAQAPVAVADLTPTPANQPRRMSPAELDAAMRDPRYNNDAAYTEHVQEMYGA